MSKKDSQDMRVRRTRKWLQEALLSLMLEKPFTKIAITEITDQAEVSRPTFYLHYRNKEEVLEDYLDSSIEILWLICNLIWIQLFKAKWR